MAPSGRNRSNFCSECGGQVIADSSGYRICEMCGLIEDSGLVMPLYDIDEDVCHEYVKCYYRDNGTMGKRWRFTHDLFLKTQLLQPSGIVLSMSDRERGYMLAENGSNYPVPGELSHPQQCCGTFKAIPEIDRPISASSMARKSWMSHTTMKRRLRKLRYTKLTNNYWLHPKGFSSIEGTSIERLLRKSPIEGWRALQKLRTFEGMPTRAGLTEALGESAFKILLESGVLKSTERFCCRERLYFYSSA